MAGDLQFHSDGDGPEFPEQIAPMLAKDCPEGRIERYLADPDYFLEEKLDGERALIHITPRGVFVTGRRISDVTGRYADKTRNLPQFAALGSGPTTILDGELILPGNQDFRLVESILGSQPERCIQLQQEYGQIHFAAFDILRLANENLTERTLEYRKQQLLLAIMYLNSCHPDVPIYELPSTPNDKKARYEDILANGGEGVMLKKRTSLYLPGKRRMDWMKIKRVVTYDAVILGFEPGQGKFNRDEVGTVIFGGFVPTGTHASLPRWRDYFMKHQAFILTPLRRWKKPAAHELVVWGTCRGFDQMTINTFTNQGHFQVGGVIEVKANGRFPTGKLRHPQFLRFRDDKAQQDCIIVTNNIG